MMLLTIYHTEEVEGYESGYLDRYWTNGEDELFVAEDNEVVAYLAVEVHREDKTDYVYLDDLSVTEKYRDIGIGSALIHEAEVYAQEIGIQHILFHVEKSNTEAFRLHKRLGYKIFRDDGNRYMMKKDEIHIFRALYERLVFQNLTYNRENPCCNEHKIPVLLIMTSNAPDTAYTDLLESYRRTLDAFVGPAEVLVSGDTLQLKDYGSTDWPWSMFNPEAKKERHVTVFPQECQKAYELGSKSL